MSSTNKTTNYDLSQFVGSDKPAWLGDYNSDMAKIDAGVHTAQTTATGADGKADANATAIGTLANLTTTAKTDAVSAINEVNSTATTASGVATAAGTTATAAKNKADSIEAYLSLVNDRTITWTASAGTWQSTGGVSNNKLSVRTNNTDSLGKIYGAMVLTNIPSGVSSITFTSSDTGIRPTSAITFNGCGYARIHSTYASGGHYRLNDISYTLNTDGTITFTAGSTNAEDITIYFWAVLLFFFNFGDVPVTPE